MPVGYKRKFYGPVGRNGYKRARMMDRTGFFGNLSKAIPAAVGAIGTYLAYRNKKYGGASGQGVTSQYDRKLVYRKKTMPRYKKRAWKRFTQKVTAVNTKILGSRTVIRNSFMTGSIGTDNNEQGILACHLYGMDGIIDVGNTCGQKDIATIFANDGNLQDQTQKAIFASGIIDITMTNASVATGETFRNESLEVDVYELVFNKTYDATWVGQLFTQAASNTASINGANPDINLGRRGATPWDLPNALVNGGVKILKKTKYLLSKGQCATYQFRDPKQYVFTRSSVDNLDDNFARRYCTRAFMIIFKGVPNDLPNNVTKVLNVGVTRKYLYKVMSQNVDVDNVIV